MSLTTFVKRPAIKDAFKTLGIQERTPASLRDRQLLVPNAEGPRGLAGTAFDYLARFHIARELRNTNVHVHERKWISERGAEFLGGDVCRSSDDKRYWRKALTDARAEVTDYISGRGDLRRLADLCQCLGHLDLLVRRMDAFDSTFRPLPNVSEEVLKLIDWLDPVDQFGPCQLCILNPEFVAAPQVSGADADLVVDDRLIELKTSAKPTVSLDYLLQLAGYAALQRMGGIRLADGAYETPFASVGIYFARYGALVQWSLGELFPNDGFSRFCDVFHEEIAAVKRTAHEDSQPPLRQASETDTDILTDFIEGELKKLQQFKSASSGDRKSGVGKGVPGFTVSGVDKKYVARYRRLAKKFGCLLLTQPKGDLIFVKLSQGTGALRK